MLYCFCLGERRLDLLAAATLLVWPSLHLISISHFPHGWAGWSLMTDALPGLFLGLFSLLGGLRHGRRGVLAMLLAGGLAGIVCNARPLQPLQQALERVAGHRSLPGVPLRLGPPAVPAFIPPQAHRLEAFRAKYLPPFQAAVDIPYDTPAAAFDRFHGLEDGFRWSDGHESSPSFNVGEQAFLGEARLQAMILDRQRLTLLLNGHTLYNGVLAGGEQDIAFEVPPGVIRPGLNSLVFRLPDAHAPNAADPRMLALALRRFSLR
ncbi:hypothetical protein [Pseudomonas sp. RIT-PI-AD]|uniref:hypothetical protein n=1 Tax=Pseudomonas sp. RIT-PI-AD TaxID=3035294 RepID=UPI0021D918F9|nr:hypothetical protein [Pseudomonas sp. RIT-PI-AD]